MRNIFKVGVICLILFMGIGSGLAEEAKKKKASVPEALSLSVAKKVASACESKAKELGAMVGIAILDEGGSLKLAYIMDGQSVVSLDWAKAKALTAFEFKKPTNRGEFKVWNIGPRTLILGASGGFSLIIDDKLLGAVGISGTKGDADDVIGRAGVKKFKELVSP